MSTTTTTERPQKPVWVRCKGSGTGDSIGCKQRVYNDPIDIDLHRRHCPADLERTVKALDRRFTALEAALEALQTAQNEAPALPDLDDVSDDWPAADEDAEDGHAGEPDEDPGLEAQELADELDEVPAAAFTSRRF